MTSDPIDRVCAQAVLRVSAVIGVAVWLWAPAAAPADPGSGPLCFRDLSAVSDGPIDLGSPTSKVQKVAPAWVDTDGDGWDDLITLTGTDQPLGYFMNRPDGEGGRTLVPAPAGNGLYTGLAFSNDGAAITAGDVDGDGDEDLFIGYGWNEDIPSGENQLLLNDGKGVFTDRTADAGLLDGNNTTAACVFFDMDLDGDLDLFTANTNFPTTDKDGDGVAHLFRNVLHETGVLEFVEETDLRGIVEYGKAVWQVSAFDYDLDGDMDLLITHDIIGLTQLYANDGLGYFTEVTDTSGSGPGFREEGGPTTFGDDSRNAMGVAIGDVENDGDLDLYIAALRYNPLYINNGDRTYREVAGEIGVEGETVAWGVLFQDFDLDGFLDLHVAAGDLFYLNRENVKPVLYHNRGDGTFDEVFASSGMRHDPPLHREMGTAASDFDGDGRVDIVVSRAHRDDGASPYLYRNETETAGRRWLSVLCQPVLEGTNRSAVGAIVRAVPRDVDGMPIPGLSQVRHVTASDSKAGRSSLWQTFGLGADAVTVDVEVVWPRAGTLEERTQSFPGIAVDTRTVLHDSEIPPPWRLSPLTHAQVPGGHEIAVVAQGSGEDAGQAALSVVQAPSWARVGDVRDGQWSVQLDTPIVQTPSEFRIELMASVPGRVFSESRQVFVLDVLPAPHIEAADLRRRGSRLRIFGVNFPQDACGVRVDGEVWDRVLVRRHHAEEDGDGSRLVAVIPRKLRKKFRKSSHVVEVIDDATGRASAPFVFAPGK